MNMPGSVPSLHTASGSTTRWTSDSCVAPPPSFLGGGGEWPAAASAAATASSTRRSIPRAGARERQAPPVAMPSAWESSHGGEAGRREGPRWKPGATLADPLGAAGPMAASPAPAQAQASTPPLVVVSQNALPQTLSYLQVCSLYGTRLWQPAHTRPEPSTPCLHRAVACRCRACRPRSATWRRGTTSSGSVSRVLTACWSSLGTQSTPSCSRTRALNSLRCLLQAAGACGVRVALAAVVTGPLATQPP